MDNSGTRPPAHEPGAAAGAGAGAATVLAFVPDLMDRSRVVAAASAAGRQLEVVRTPAELVERATAVPGVSPDTLVLLDLGRPGVVEALAALGGVTSVGFASHVDRDLLRRARAAGCGRVLARSAFFGGLGELLAAGASPRGPSA
jgi:hypothetical protein